MFRVINILINKRLGIVFPTFMFCSFLANSQLNLVPNPSFEIYDTCPYNNINPAYSGIDAICKAIPWFQPNSPNLIGHCSGSTDFLHSCNGSVPQNIMGFQYARTGLGYAGAGITDNPNVSIREYLQSPLVTNLKREKYCVSFYVNTPSIEWSSTNCIQARFTKDSVLTNTFDKIFLTDGIDATEILRDTLNWLLVKGIYAAGGEKNL